MLFHKLIFTLFNHDFQAQISAQRKNWGKQVDYFSDGVWREAEVGLRMLANLIL
ncbi:hypothetical protein P780_04780 [Vibrio mimicus CAIM 1882]|nr:hypothetical protein P780_04780 [Vibrio mimicus CAIM 1882]